MLEDFPNYIEYGNRTNVPITHYFSVKSIQEMRLNNPVRKLHYHSLLYQINWITEGSYELFADHKKIKAEKNNLVLIKPNTIHSNRFTHHLKGCVIHYSKDFLESYISLNKHLKHVINGETNNRFIILKVKKADLDEFNDLFNKIMIIYDEGTLLKNEILSGYLNLILLKIYEYLIQENTKTSNNQSLIIFNRFIEHLEKNYKLNKTVNEYASLLHISPGYLNSIVKEETGKTAGNLIRNRVVDEAKQQLICTEKNISEISYGLNFKDPSYFCRLFKKGTGISPKDFRKTYSL